MKWRKLGNIFDISARDLGPYGISHCANPRAINLHGDIFRIFYCSRDLDNRSSVFAIDFDISSLSILHVYTEPFLTYGKQNSYFSDGISIGNFYEVNGIRYLTFMGWKNPENEHWFGQIGIAELTANYELNLMGDDTKPMIPLDNSDSISLSYPWVTKLPDDTYEMWYGSTKSWVAESNTEMVHILKRRCSSDGFNWNETTDEVPFFEGIAQAFSSPCIYDFGKYKQMWFSYRSGSGTPYRIGSAISYGNSEWELSLNEMTISPSEVESDWDANMVEYPFVFEHKKMLYMLYNGDGYGKTGFGLAILR
ncbi:hypothetical protein BIY22_12895 [Vibrio panuliri]|uniref:Glycosyl hydrolase family 32 N-terminal domain-containing protein n=1 Tax=Vibrio panuliri TaxID=1381081 RepID=A0A1Q9HAL4_9VIBR|nr:hypothetical protein [Vibrio panuliri]OLQ86141.1 hypothetical protein BIY22_12895 [Vibrio panuliri]